MIKKSRLVLAIIFLLISGSLGYANLGSDKGDSKYEFDILLSKFKQLETRVVKLEASFPKGNVAAYNLSKCLDGWNDFSDGHGRMILGLGAGKQLKPRMKLLSTGGAEAVKLTN